jgi:hypothetical protein
LAFDSSVGGFDVRGDVAKRQRAVLRQDVSDGGGDGLARLGAAGGGGMGPARPLCLWLSRRGSWLGGFERLEFMFGCAEIGKFGFELDDFGADLFKGCGHEDLRLKMCGVDPSG